MNLWIVILLLDSLFLGMPAKIHIFGRIYCRTKKIYGKTTYFILQETASHIALNNEISSQPQAPPPILDRRLNLLSRAHIDSGANRRVVAAFREQISKWDSCLKRIRVTARWQGRHLQCAFRESLGSRTCSPDTDVSQQAAQMRNSLSQDCYRRR